MSRHEGVSCDCCLTSNFRGKRHKCLVCYDYDLCSTCYEQGATSTRHVASHPMQCILTRADFELYYSGEPCVGVDTPQSFTCPFCGKMGYTESTLQDHVGIEHADPTTEVVCPVCAALPGGDPNFVTDDFAAHLAQEHRSLGRDHLLGDEGIVCTGSSAGGGGSGPGSRSVRRVPVPTRQAAMRGGRRSHTTQYLGSIPSSGGQAGSGGGSGNTSTFPGLPMGGASHRNGLGHHAHGSGSHPADPIAELLAQLSSVRNRASATQSVSMQLQQLELQLLSTRQQLERLPRRHAELSSGSQPGTGSGSGSAGGGKGAAVIPPSSAAIISSLGGPHGLISLPPNNLSDGNPLLGHFTQHSTHGAAVPSASAALPPSADTGATASSSSTTGSRPSPFLLAGCLDGSESDAADSASIDAEAMNRSLFVQELLLSTLTDNMKISVDDQGNVVEENHD